jgi:hypothetical protein
MKTPISKNIFVHIYTSEIVEIHIIDDPINHPRLREVEDRHSKKYKIIDPKQFGHDSEPEYLDFYDCRNCYEDSNGRLMQYTNDYTSIEEYVSNCYKTTFEYSIDDTSDDPQEMVTICHAKAMLASGSAIPRAIELNAVIRESIEKCTELLNKKHKKH